MIPAIQEIGFGPGTEKSYATLHQATVSFAEMGERTISTQVRIDGDVVPDFSGWELSFKGERFILNTKEPQAAKDNSTRNSLVDLTFVSWVVNELKRYFFFEPTSIDSSTAIADKYNASVNVPVEDFAVLFNKVLDYYFDGKVVFSLYMSGQGQYSTDRALVEINYTYIWDVLVKFFEIYGVRWRIEHDSTNDIYTIKAGWPTTEIDINDHDFEYGYQGGLLRFERQVQDVNIHNILLGRGGEKNIPYRYFKRIDPQNPDWAADPDAIPELSNIYFDRLRDINFRWYVRGWMQNPNHDTSWEDDGYEYPIYPIDSDSPYYFAYLKGLTDDKFNPVEYVKDDESIADYGEHWGALDDNDDIFPTIQGVTRAPIGRIDEAVAVSEIVTDDISAMAQNAAIEKSINRMTISLDGDTRTAFDIQSEEFTIPSGSTGNVTYVPVGTDDVNPGLVRFDTDNSSVVAVSDGTEYPIDAIPAGTYRLKLHLVIARTGQASSATGTFGIENIVLTTSTMDTDAWKPTFDIWVKNIWGTTKEDGENDIQYAERVWLPILGDRAGNEAKVVFSSGFMSVSEDYEFTIASYPVYDTSKSINGVPSEWRITLRKSDAEFDATGLYIPNASTGGQPVAGDKFFFIGIDMPHAYVTLAEEDLNTNKTAQLDTEAAISPTWIMNLDKVRVHTLEDQEYGRTLADRLAAGGKVWIKDKRFTPGTRLQLYVQSITYTWNEPTNESPYIVPDIEVVLSDKVVAVDSVVQRIQNDVSSIKNQYARISDVEAVVRSVAEPIFLKKTGESDSSDSPTQFSSKVTSKGFRQGAIGGTGWGIYRDNTKSFAPDENEQASPTRGARSLRSTRPLLAEQEQEEADAVIEADRIVVRKELQVNSLVINQIAYIGGKEIISAAKIEVSKVIETADSYICYFDQRRNSVANNFAVNDIAFGQVFNPDNTELRYYKMVVTATDVDCITLGKTPNDGSGVPKVGDIIVQYGNTTNASRQYVIVRDVIGGGYERMLSGLSTVSSTGKEYYFAGRQGNAGPRWFVGDSLGDYAEYENGVLTIKANVIFKAGQEIPGLSALETQVDNLEYLHTALPKSDTIVNGGLILSKVIALRDALDNIKSGINGDPSLSSIAAWYGGPMADKEASPTPASYAKSLFRFDGSGYLAGGNIRWNDQGYGSIPGVSWDNGEIRISGDVKLTSVGDNTVTSLLTAVQNMPSTYVTIATAQTVSGFKTFTGGIQIGDATITWVDGGNGNPGYLRIDQAILTVGDQIVLDGSPGGGGGGGGGSSYLRDLLDVSVSSRSNGDILRYNGSVWVNTAPSQLPVATGTTNGLMSSSDYSKLAGIAAGATAVNESTVAGWGFTKNAGTVTGVKREGDVNPYSPNASGIVTIPAYPTTLPNPNALTFGNRTYNGSAVAEITAADLGALTSHQPIYNLVIKSSAGATQLTYRPATNGTYELQLTSGMVGLEYVDNLAAADYFTALTSGSSDLLSITIGGTTKKLTTLYASRLTTVSKTAWGQTYWTANGIPANISGNMSSVGNITPSANNSKNLGSSALSWNNLYVKRVYLTGSVYFEYDTNGSYVKLNAPLVTDGDQIVISGTPGGGGGGGATTLQGLDDTNINSPSSTQVLQYLNGKWTNVNSTEVGVTSVKIGNTSYNPSNGVVSLPAYAFGIAGSDYVPITIGTTTKNVLTAHQSVTLASGTNNGTLKLTTAAGTVDNIAVKGLGSLAYLSSLDRLVLMSSISNDTFANYISAYAKGVTASIISDGTTVGDIPGYSTVLNVGNGSARFFRLISQKGGNLYYQSNNSGSDGWNARRLVYDSVTLTKAVVTGLIGDTTYHPYGGGSIAFEASTITSSGDVNIGASGYLKLNRTDARIYGGSTSSVMLFRYREDNQYLAIGSGTYQTAYTTIYGNDIRFTTYDGSASERMRILANGRVAVNATSSSYQFYVNGTLGASGLATLSGGATIPSSASLKIGEATLSWVAGTGGNPGYLKIDKAFVTEGDQIVIDGDPGGGGGGGGASALADLNDVHLGTLANNNVLVWDSTIGTGGGWKNVAGVISVAGRTGAVTLTTSDITNIETWIANKGYVTSSGITSVTKGTATDGGAVLTSGGAVTIQFPTVPTIPGVVSASANGLAPQYSSGNRATSASGTTYYLLGWNGTGSSAALKWYSLPANAFKDTTYSQGTGISISETTIALTPAIQTSISNGDSAYTTLTTSQTKNKVLASPSNASGAPSFRALVAADIPDLSGTYQTKYGFTINGTSGQSYNLATISSNASNGNTAYNSLGNYLPLSGGTMTGALTLNADTTSHGSIYLDNGKFIVGTLADGTTTANLLGMSSADQCIVAYGMRSTGTTAIYGQTMYFRSAASVGPEIYFGCSTHNKDAATIYFNSHATDLRNGIKIGAEYAEFADRLNLVVYTSNVGASPYTPSWSPTLKVTYTGMVGIGLASPTEKLHVSGNILSTGDQVVSSDITKKTNLVPIDLKVEQIAGAPAVTFDWKTGGHSFGSIAQYWKDKLGEAVLGTEGNYALAYGQLALVNTIIEAREIDKLKARVAELEAEVKRLRMN